jgi:hypothetical protein
MASERSGAVHDLQRAIREVRMAESERSDVVVELREAERTRLDLLAEALAPVAADLPEGYDEFSLAVLPGDPPRYWVDATAFVMMGRDKRTYRFLRDSRLGRSVIAESSDIDEIAGQVTRYVAERVVEKERALAADWAERSETEADRQPAAPPAKRDRSGFWTVVGFFLGVIAGAGLLLAYAWVRVG